MSVAIVGTGANLASLQFALERQGAESTVTLDAERIRAASHVILPGVGAAAPAMARLREGGLDRVIPELRQPVLGICLGMQLLFETSEEGDVECLGVLPGHVARLSAMPHRPVPHMGWNTLERVRESALLEGIEPGDSVYFVHSYAVGVGEEATAAAEYGTRFTACAERENFFGVQFHPERSGTVGARVLANFLGLTCS